MIKVANAPCSWGVIENIAGERITWKTVLNEIQATGYVGTELGDWGFMPTDPARLADELTSRGLEMVGSWVSVHMHDATQLDADIHVAVKTAGLMAAVGGNTPIVVLGNDPFVDPMRTGNAGRITTEHEMSASQWKTFCSGAEAIAKAVKAEAGLRTVLHHHVGTWVETPAETRRFLDNTDPALLGLVYDTGHWKFGGGDPRAGIKEFWDRIRHVHFKGFSQEIADRSRAENWDAVQSYKNGVFSELATADIDFPPIAEFLKKQNYDGWIVVEQDVLPGMGRPKESAQRNRDYLREIGL
ncbi:MAG: TIM barrel protein [Spirochaeta sp.]|jgi:inosose dehydratase|nr:TIM barrel protein [Spirochaeta sp.]